MSSQNENDSDDLLASRSTSTGTLAAAAPALPRKISPPNVILFLDNNQDARSTKSTIQRHTAHHAAAQRREARLQSSRDVTPRNLEWQRRPGADTPVSSGSDATTLEVPVPKSPEIRESAQQDRSYAEAEQTASVEDQRRLSSETSRSNSRAPIGSLEPFVSSPVLRSIGEDDACNEFVQAYQLALRAQSLDAQDPRHWQARETSLEQVSRGLSILRNRLASAHESCSDPTIQAVLVLFVYATNFQTPDEAASHKAALEKMISLRGGLNSFGHNTILEKQLERYAFGEVEQILRIKSRA